MAEGARLESVYTATYRGFESPPHRHISDESRYLCIGSFLLYSPMGGMRIPDRGSTTGAARWTEWPQAMTPAGRAKRVNPPLTAIFQMRAGTYVSALFFYIPQWGDENPRPGVDNERSQSIPLTTLCDIRLKNKARFSRALSAKIANLTVRIQRSLAERRANAIIFIEANNPYHFIFFKAGQRVTEP